MAWALLVLAFGAAVPFNASAQSCTTNGSLLQADMDTSGWGPFHVGQATGMALGNENDTPNIGVADADNVENVSLGSGTAGSGWWVSITLTPVAAGPWSVEITGWGVCLYGTADQVYGTLSASSSSLSCGTTTVGMSGSCGDVTLTANGGPVTLPSPLYTLSSSTGLLVSGGTCSAGEVLSTGASCTLGPVNLEASTPGSYSSTLTVSTANSGSASVAISGTAALFQCQPNAAQDQYCLLTSSPP